jgi:hypothetical protein
MDGLRSQSMDSLGKVGSVTNTERRSLKRWLKRLTALMKVVNLIVKVVNLIVKVVNLTG